MCPLPEKEEALANYNSDKSNMHTFTVGTVGSGCNLRGTNNVPHPERLLHCCLKFYFRARHFSPSSYRFFFFFFFSPTTNVLERKG